MGWQPIETAPKDGAVLLFFGRREWRDDNGEPVSFGRVRDMAERVEIGFCADGYICEAFTGHDFFEPWRDDDTPTHWMPLPEPPQDAR